MAHKRFHGLAMLLSSVAMASLPTPVLAQSDQTYQFDLREQDLGDALRAVAARAGWEIYATASDVNGIRAPRLEGALTARQAIERLLAGTNLRARFRDGAVIIRGRSTSPTDGEIETADSAIIVTGTRIKGSPPAAPVTIIDQRNIVEAGQSDLGEMARSLPMNFGGGQNPGVGSSQGVPNQNGNVNGASTFNLRGIGSDATLTLLNGNRLSYSGVSAAIDVSSIPVAAVDRVEISADGASAIYGADAVAGVVNVILKKDYTGLFTSARIGGSTDGGDFQQQYGMVSGSTWDGGGVLIAYDFFRNEAIKAADRSYTNSINPDSTIYPTLYRHSLLATGHHQLADGIRLTTDFIFKTGEMNSANGYTVDRPIELQGNEVRRKFETAGIAPGLSFDLPSRWTATVSGFYGVDNTDGVTKNSFGGAPSSTVTGRFRNKSEAVEISAQGPLFALPGGSARLAIGGGFRKYRYTNDDPRLYLSRQRRNYFAYAETFLPLIGEAQGLSFARAFSVTGAVRLEDYSDSSSIVTPKAGVIFEPVAGLEIKGSWGRSFKLPALFQQYSGYAAVLLPASGYGDTFPPGSTYIVALGANDNVKAERSENWSVSAEARPLTGLSLSASYFHILYTDRVAPPLTSVAGALTNPIYASMVRLNPTEAQQAAIINSASAPGLQNATSGPYNPANVAALLDARDRNVARQWYRGVDLAARYDLTFEGGDSLMLSGSATWLRSKQLLLPGLPTAQLAGRIFNPPRFKARGGARYGDKRFSVSGFVNYVGGVIDARRAQSLDIASMTTFDLTGRMQFGSFEVGLNALNLFNAKPDTIYTSSPSDTPFDTTNYSAAGRFLSLSVSHKW